ncbi:MAG: response regulator [Bacteroidia bacterium]|nr:response regulator [Bacteroidia bacterium]
MTELIIEVEDKSILASLKKILSNLDGVKVRKNTSRRKTGIELALEDVEAGRVFTAKDADDLIRQCLE